MNSIDQEKINKLKKIDSFIKEESEIEEEDCINNKLSSLNLEKEVDTRVNNSPCLVSTAIEEYIDSDFRNKNLEFRNKLAELERGKYFDLYKEEYSDFLSIVWRKYKNLHEETDNYFNKIVKKFPGFGEFAETALYFAFVKKMEEEGYFNVDFIPGLCSNLTINQLLIRKEVYRKAFNDNEEQIRNDISIIYCTPENLATLLSIFKISKCEDPYEEFWDK
jgi:hypothetical protein